MSRFVAAGAQEGGNRIRSCFVTVSEILSHQTWPNPLSPHITLSGRMKRTSQCHWLPLRSCGDIKRHYMLCCRWRKLHLPCGSSRKAASYNGGWGLDLMSPCACFLWQRCDFKNVPSFTGAEGVHSLKIFNNFVSYWLLQPNGVNRWN